MHKQTLAPNDATWLPQRFVNIGSGDGLLSDDTKPLAERNLVKYKWDPVAVIWGSYFTENATDTNNWNMFENCAHKITSYGMYIYLIYSGKTRGISPNVHKPFKSVHFICNNLDRSGDNGYHYPCMYWSTSMG